jgi:hypothetical protein
VQGAIPITLCQVRLLLPAPIDTGRSELRRVRVMFGWMGTMTGVAEAGIGCVARGCGRPADVRYGLRRHIGRMGAGIATMLDGGGKKL